MALIAETVELKKGKQTQNAGGKRAKSGKKGDDTKKTWPKICLEAGPSSKWGVQDKRGERENLPLL
jgi:hypothetical protein